MDSNINQYRNQDGKDRQNILKARERVIIWSKQESKARVKIMTRSNDASIFKSMTS